jgi:hypothetical protein
MKTIIAGSRTLLDPTPITTAIRASGFEISEVVSGGAAGVDRYGEIWASFHAVPLTIFPADWKTHGKAAGPIRNMKMAEYADALIAVWDGKSRGTKNMIDLANQEGLRVHIHLTK